MNRRVFRDDRLRKAMKENGATIEDICDAFNLCSKSSSIESYIYDKERKRSNRNSVELIINGFSTPTLAGLYIICEIVNCSADYLLGLSDDIN